MPGVDALRVTTVGPWGLRGEVEDALAAGGVVEALFAAHGADGVAEVRCVVALPDGPLLVRCPLPAGVAPSVVDLVPALDWDEREAHDLHGVTFEGGVHRPLVDHPEDPAAWMTPVAGTDVHQVAVGPIHAGVIESGHFRFHAVGERILHVDARLFHKHRGLERAAEGRAAPDALPVVQRACAACAVANTVAFAEAVEQARGMWPDEPMRRARTLLLELERLYNHLNDLGQICAGVGLAPGAMAFAGFKERAQRVVHGLVGHRFLFGSVAVGASDLPLPAAAVAAARRDLADLRADATRAGRSLLLDAALRDRTRGTGVVSRDEARRLGMVGPAARASGLAGDVREGSPRLWYAGFRAASPEDPAGDVAARVEVRVVELRQTFDLLDDLLSGPLGPGGATVAGSPRAHGVGRVEGARGRTVCAVELDGDVARRVHLRTGSYANWPAVARAAAGATLPDFPLINKSFELCYACVDR
ncbi:NADH-quinone oxidoreductase subunit C [Miltoncostaea oceani]|uniref:hydrogenase large subunit n=1 Tax=Miltoncostaea oceani TaxID=2843216 RepID=UPI001C3DDA2F|nr:NADH-quinone oxidoreductase subunit C [Miltoncostaea oceani]